MIGLFKHAANATSSLNFEKAKEEIQYAWSGIQIDGAIRGWDNEIKADALQTELRKKDDEATAIHDGNNIIVNYLGYETIINCNDSLIIETGGFDYDEERSFDGGTFINTGVSLYSDENIHKNFIIELNIDEIYDGNVHHNTLLSSMDESGSPWPGHNVKVVVEGGKTKIKFQSNSNNNSEGDVTIPNNVKNVRIIRIGDKLYYSFDGGDFILINDYTGFTDTFDLPVTFGAALGPDNKPFRYFKGKLSNMSVKFLSDNAKIEQFNKLKTVYEYAGNYRFNGTSDIINTGLCMFTEENIDKDFEISFNIEEIESGYVNQATVVNAKWEKNPYPGFVYRLYVDSETIKFESKGGSGSGATNKQKDVKSVKLSRVNRIMYLSINNGESKHVYDFTDFTNFYNVPLTIGASLQEDGTPFRYFKGTLSNIVIKVADD